MTTRYGEQYEDPVYGESLDPDAWAEVEEFRLAQGISYPGPLPYNLNRDEAFKEGQARVELEARHTQVAALLLPLADLVDDARFNALRLPGYARNRAIELEAGAMVGGHLAEWGGTGIDHSLGAIVRAATACGAPWAIISWAERPFPRWECSFGNETGRQEGMTPELAAASALLELALPRLNS